jgi:hypothetical protein
MPEAKFTSVFTGQQVESAIKKALTLNTFEFEHVSDELINGTVFHILWLNTPTEDNQAKGFTMCPTTGRIYEVFSNCKQFSITRYVTDDDTIQIFEIDSLFNS